MATITEFRPRPKPRTCLACGQPLARWQPIEHTTCRRCYSFDRYGRAVFAFLEATRPR